MGVVNSDEIKINNVRKVPLFHLLYYLSKETTIENNLMPTIDRKCYFVQFDTKYMKLVYNIRAKNKFTVHRCNTMLIARPDAVFITTN